MRTLLYLFVFLNYDLYAVDLKEEIMQRIKYVKEYKDYSSFYFSAGSEEQSKDNSQTMVHFIITDSYGRKTGFKSFYIYPEGYRGIKSYREIPNSSYTVEESASLDPDDPDEPESATLNFFPPVEKDTYTIQFIGFDNCRYHFVINAYDQKGKHLESLLGLFESYITSGTTQQYSIYLDPTPGAPPPVLTKVVTFQTIKEDIEVAYKLNQIGDDKFTKSLLSMINIAEKLYNKCEKMKDKDKLKKQCYRPVVAILRMMMKRLEVINKLCDNKTECKSKCKVMTECDEDEVFKGFDNKYRKDIEFKDFFSEWDKDEYHKHKKTCKRYVSDEALEIIATDINWFIKGFGEEVWNDYKKEHNPYIPEKYKQFFK